MQRIDQQQQIRNHTLKTKQALLKEKKKKKKKRRKNMMKKFKNIKQKHLSLNEIS